MCHFCILRGRVCWWFSLRYPTSFANCDLGRDRIKSAGISTIKSQVISNMKPAVVFVIFCLASAAPPCIRHSDQMVALLLDNVERLTEQYIKLTEAPDVDDDTLALAAHLKAEAFNKLKYAIRSKTCTPLGEVTHQTGEFVVSE
jgi:hypothetical protein